MLKDVIKIAGAVLLANVVISFLPPSVKPYFRG
jgi:hypothetical protein